MSECTVMGPMVIAGGAVVLLCQALYKGAQVILDEHTWVMAAERENKLQKYMETTSFMAGESRSSDIVASHIMAQARAELEKIETTIHLLEDVPNLRTYINHNHSEAITALHKSHKTLSTVIKSGSVSGMQETVRETGLIGNELKKLILKSHNDMKDAEIKVTSNGLKESLNELGYRLDTLGPYVRATQKQTTIWSCVDSLGRVHVDVSGLSGMECLVRTKEIERKLEDKGFRMQRLSSRFHGRKEGGVLTQGCMSVGKKNNVASKKPMSQQDNRMIASLGSKERI